MKFIYSDGGRAAAGFKGDTGDCVTRAISIATGKHTNPVDSWMSYLRIYNALNKLGDEMTLSASMRGDGLTKRARQLAKSDSRKGVARPVYDAYLAGIGWTWTPTMKIGSGCKVHLKSHELPAGKLIVRLSHHLAAVIDGVLYDTYDCSRDETRCVYGYYLTKN